MRAARLLALLFACLALPSLLHAQRDSLRIEGQIFTADGDSVSGIRVRIRSASGTVRTAVSREGRFTLLVPTPVDGHLELSTYEEDSPRYHPTRIRLEAGDLAEEYRIILVPRRWELRRGAHAGDTVEIDLRQAFVYPCARCPAFYLRGSREQPSPPPTWPPEVFPIRIAFDRESEDVRLTERDSTRFWRIVEELEEETGRDLFRPASFEDARLRSDRPVEDVLLVRFDRRLRRVGWGSTLSQQGDIFFGTIRVRDPRVFASTGGARLIKHELMHALGVGHTCEWRSLMAEIPQCSNRRSTTATAKDVAYLEILFRVRELQRAVNAAFGLRAAR